MTNREAIEHLLLEYAKGGTYTLSPFVIAAWLAAHGVLAVDAITDAQIVYLPIADVKPAEVRAALRRLATGEQE